MTVGLWCIRWAGGRSKCALIVPWQRAGWLESIDFPPTWDRRASGLAVFTDELPKAKVYATREAAAHDASRLGLGEVVDLEAEWQQVQAATEPATSTDWATVAPLTEMR